jgi:hypothetical protein
MPAFFVLEALMIRLSQELCLSLIALKGVLCKVVCCGDKRGRMGGTTTVFVSGWSGMSHIVRLHVHACKTCVFQET